MTDFETSPPKRPETSAAFSVSRILGRTDLRHVEYHPQLSSTSDTARELLGQLLDLSPALVLTDRQTAGRGRQGRTWLAGPGALTFSFVIDAGSVDLPPERRGLVAIAAGAAVHAVLVRRVSQSTVSVKWPNDVLVGGRKICGVLVEQHQSNGRTGIVIGIGINVNNSLADAPPEIQQNATSLFDLLKTSVSREELLIESLNSLSDHLQQLQSRLPPLMARINAAHVLQRRKVIIDQAGTIIGGTCVGIDDDGCLVLRQDDGRVDRVRSGTVCGWT